MDLEEPGSGGGGGNGPPSDGGDPVNSSEDDDHEGDSTSTSEDERLYRIYRNRHLFAAGAGGPGDPDPNIPWIFRDMMRKKRTQGKIWTRWM